MNATPIYVAAGFFLRYLIPEFLMMLSPSPRSYKIPTSMNIMSGAVIAAVAHYLLTH